jgi:hypothetical protein
MEGFKYWNTNVQKYESCVVKCEEEEMELKENEN